MIKSMLMIIWLFFSVTVYAEKAVFNTGEIVLINKKIINFNDQKFLLSPTVKVWSANKKKITLSELKVGDYVVLSMIKIGKKKLVDHIHMSPFTK